MISNITVFGLNNKFSKEVGKMLSDKLDMFFADVMELLTFDFIDLVQAENIVGRDYILKQERVKIKTLSSYDNTVICCDFRSLNTLDNYENLKKGSVMVYLKPDSQTLLNINKKFSGAANFDLFNDVRMDYLDSKADVVCNINSTEIKDIVKQIIFNLEEYYNKKGV